MFQAINSPVTVMVNALSKLRRLNLGHSVRESGYYSGRNRRSRSILMRLAGRLPGCLSVISSPFLEKAMQINFIVIKFLLLNFENTQTQKERYLPNEVTFKNLVNTALMKL